jgi:hypothetical protein
MKHIRIEYSILFVRPAREHFQSDHVTAYQIDFRLIDSKNLTSVYRFFQFSNIVHIEYLISNTVITQLHAEIHSP